MKTLVLLLLLLLTTSVFAQGFPPSGGSASTVTTSAPLKGDGSSGAPVTVDPTSTVSATQYNSPGTWSAISPVTNGAVTRAYIFDTTHALTDGAGTALWSIRNGGNEVAEVKSDGTGVFSGGANLGGGCFTTTTGANTVSCTISSGTNVTWTTGANGHFSLGADACLKTATGECLLYSGGGDVTIGSGFGVSPSITSKSTLKFDVTVGSGGTANSGVLNFPANTTNWNCYCEDTTTFTATVFRTRMTANGTTSCTIGNFSSSASAAAWTAGDVLHCIAVGS